MKKTIIWFSIPGITSGLCFFAFDKLVDYADTAGLEPCYSCINVSYSHLLIYAIAGGTLGAILGYIFYLLFNLISRRKYQP